MLKDGNCVCMDACQVIRRRVLTYWGAAGAGEALRAAGWKTLCDSRGAPPRPRIPACRIPRSPTWMTCVVPCLCQAICCAPWSTPTITANSAELFLLPYVHIIMKIFTTLNFFLKMKLTHIYHSSMRWVIDRTSKQGSKILIKTEVIGWN